MLPRIFQKIILKKGKPPQKTAWRLFLKICLTGAAIAILSGIGTFGYFSKDLPSLEKIEKQETIQPSRIYDRTGKILLFEIKGEQEKILIPLSEISPWLQKATVACEDSNFYSHFGLNFKSILRAIISNLKVKIGLKEKTAYIQGGSTITQQVIKNALLTPERTLNRKIKEAILSLELEFRYSKDQILELYLNQASYGSNAYGTEAASRLFFGKSAKELTLAESAILAALPRAPSRLYPYGSHLDELFARQEYILERMESFGMISNEEKEAAKRQVPKFSSKFSGIKAPHFVMYVKEFLEQRYGAEYLKKGGLKIYTTLDWDLQEIAEKAIKSGAEKNKQFNAHNAALAAMDPKTGQILAMIGSKDYFGDSYPENCQPGKNCLFDPNVNVASSSRQPGSAFKPFVYALAFQKGYTPQTVLFDVKTEFNPACPSDASREKSDYGMDCYHPKNYDEKVRGPVNLKQALAQSLNIPSVKLLYLTGINDSLNLARKSGIETLNRPENHYGLSLVLGGGEVKLLDLVSAYGIFASNGILNPKTAILKIEDGKSKIVEEFKQKPGVILEENIAFIINDILSDNEARAPMFGVNSPLNLGERPAAAKTGTSQDYKDAWTIGYTPSLVCGIWAGNNDNTPIEKKAGGYIAAPMWNEFMKGAYDTKIKNQILNIKNNNEFTLPEEVEEFIKPEIELTEKPILDGDFIGKTRLKIDTISEKLAGPLTPPDLIEEKDFLEIHSILHYVEKDEPRGEPTINPEMDSQYKNWEEGIKIWLNLPGNEFAKNLQLRTPPTDYDNLHTEENLPRINLLSPPPESRFGKNSRINIKFLAKAPLGIEKAEYFLDEIPLDSKTFSPLEEEREIEGGVFLPKNIGEGIYILKIKVTDAAKNKTEKETPIIVE